MTLRGHVRRTATVLCALAVVVVLPTVAYAQFRDSPVAATTVGTVLLAAPGSVTVSCLSKGNARLTWTTAAGATAYRVYQKEGNAAFVLVATVAAPTTSLSGAVDPKKDYSYKMESTVQTWVSPQSPVTATVRCN